MKNGSDGVLWDLSISDSRCFIIRRDLVGVLRDLSVIECQPNNCFKMTCQV